MGFRNPFRIQVDRDGVAYVTDYSPDSQVPEQFRGPAGTGRVEVVRKPSNYGWPLCYSPNLPYYRWDFNTSTPLDATPTPYECGNPARDRTTRRAGTPARPRPDRPAGTHADAADHPAGHLVLVPRQPEPAAGHALLRVLRARARWGPARSCSPSCSPAASGRTAPPRTTSTRRTRARRSSRRTTTGRWSSASSRRTPCVRSGSTPKARSTRSTSS